MNPGSWWPLAANRLTFVARHHGTVRRTDRSVTVTCRADPLSFWVPLAPDEPVPDDVANVQLCPGSGPGWPDRLAAAGFAPSVTLLYQTAPVDAPVADLTGREIERVRTDAAAAEFAAVQEEAFREPGDDAAAQDGWLRLFTDAARRNHAAPDQAFFLARWGGRAAAVALCVYTDGLCGVYAVGTHPAFRGRGLATALLERVRQDAVARGAGRLTLQVAAGSAAERLYRRLGFADVFDSPGYARPARRSASAMAPSA